MIAIDFSMNSAGIVIGDSSNPEDLHMLCFRQRKRDESLSKKIVIEEYANTDNNELRYYTVASKILNFIETHSTDDDKIVYIEDYSYGSTGSVFNIAEATATLKHLLWINGYIINKISPKSIKKFATGSGNATKGIMYSQFLENTKFDFNTVLVGPKKNIESGDINIPSPVSDLVDAYFLLQYGLTEARNSL